MIERHHDGHFFEKFLELRFVELRLLNSFGGSVQACVPSFDFVDTTEASSAYFLDNGVIVEIIDFFHFDKLIPLDFDFFNILYVFRSLRQDVFLVVLDCPIFSLMNCQVHLRNRGISELSCFLFFEPMVDVEIMIERGYVMKRGFTFWFAGTGFSNRYGWLGMSLGNTCLLAHWN